MTAERVQDIEVDLLLDAIRARYGHDLRGYARASMRRRVLAALARSGLRHLGELQHELLSDAAFFDGVLADLTVHVTEMFRDPSFYKAFRERVMPVLRTYPVIRIWHAGCASGEEVYATAILLTEAGLYDRAQIYATDLSVHSLALAKQGTYSAEDVPKFAANYVEAGGTADLSDYYTAAYDGIAMNESLRRHVVFLQHDLVSDYVFGEMHVVFCRNVLIYFDRELRGRILDKLAQSLCPGGFLCLGSSEHLTRLEDLGSFVEFAPRESVYRNEA